MKEFKVRHSKRQISLLGVTLAFLVVIFSFAIKSLIDENIPLPSIYITMIPVAVLFLILLIIYIDYIIYTINVEYNHITVKRLFSNKTYYFDTIEYTLSEALSSNRAFRVDRSINKNKFRYTIHFKNGKVKYDDNMDNSDKFLKVVSKYSLVDRPLSR